MLLEQVKEDIQSGGLGAGNAFTIAASAKAFEVLSSNLYQNKVLAVIREITCNAVDAHRMVGKPISDIKITMPTLLAPHFAVRDYGPGLAHDDVLSLYTTYFRSTKDASNDLIGGFGLGSKSPFAVAEQFTVTSWHGGECRVYVCYKDGGVPAINHISTTPTTEPNGLEVQVAATTTGLSRWKEEAANLFRWWPEVPRGIKDVEYMLKPEWVAARASTNVGAYPEWVLLSQVYSPVVLMGGVPYSLNFTAIAGLPHDTAYIFSGLGLVLAFDVGALAISPSREALSYDKATSAALCQRLASIRTTLQAEVEASIAQAPTLWDARKILYGNEGFNQQGQATLSAAAVLKRFRTQTAVIRWQGKTVQQNVTISLKTDFSAPAVIGTTTKAPHRRTYDKQSMAWDFTQQASHQGYEIWLWDLTITGKSYRKAQHTLEVEAPDHKEQYGRMRQPLRVAHIISGVPFDEAERVFVARGLPPLRKVSDLADPPKAAPGTRKTSATKGYVRDAHNGAWSRMETAIDLTTPGYWSKFFDGSSQDMDNRTMRDFISLGVLNASKPIIGLTKRRWEAKNFEANMTKLGWTRLGKDLIHGVPVARVQQEAYQERLGILFQRWPGQLHKMLGLLTGLVKDPEFDRLAKIIVADFKPRQYDRTYSWQYAENFNDAQKVAAKAGHAAADVVLSDWGKYAAKHPLLKGVIVMEQVRATDIADYLNR